jgi:hypothetical protein
MPTSRLRYSPVFIRSVDAIFLGERIHLGALFRPGLPVILLARSGFFSLFKVCFNEQRRRFSLERY